MPGLRQAVAAIRAVWGLSEGQRGTSGAVVFRTEGRPVSLALVPRTGDRPSVIRHQGGWVYIGVHDAEYRRIE